MAKSINPATKHRCSYPAPQVVSVKLPNGNFTTREWEPGEKAAYERSVLGREPGEPYPTGIASLKQLSAPLAK
jgi:hypothetical protein